jgi:hypothetical protein
VYRTVSSFTFLIKQWNNGFFKDGDGAIRPSLSGGGEEAGRKKISCTIIDPKNMQTSYSDITKKNLSPETGKSGPPTRQPTTVTKTYLCITHKNIY